MNSVTFDHETQTFDYYDGKKVSSAKTGLPKKITHILTDGMPQRIAAPLLKSGVKILRCSMKSAQQFGEKYNHDERTVTIWELYKAIPNSFKPLTIDPPIAAFFTIFKDYQRFRVATGNRLLSDQSEEMQEFNDLMDKGERELKKKVAQELEKLPIYQQWLLNIKGIGPSMGAGVVAMLGDCSRFRTVSCLWAYCGYAVNAETGAIQKKTKGEQANWNPRIKPHLYNLVVSFLKQKTPVYSDLYYEEKEKQMAREGITKLHAHNRAIRKVAKVFLEHYFCISREIAGLEVPKPWIIQHGGHTNYIPAPFWGQTWKD